MDVMRERIDLCAAPSLDVALSLIATKNRNSRLRFVLRIAIRVTRRLETHSIMLLFASMAHGFVVRNVLTRSKTLYQSMEHLT